jgi:hypothetical protein
MFKAVCKLGLEGIVSKKLDSPYKSGPSKAWLKIKNPKAPAATRAAMDFLDRERNLSPELDGLRPSVSISPEAGGALLGAAVSRGGPCFMAPPSTFSARPRATTPRNGLPNAIAKSEADDHS